MTYAGRSFAPENDHPNLKIWSNSMQRFRELTEEALRPLGITVSLVTWLAKLLKRNSAFLPDPISSIAGVKAAKPDQEEVIRNVQKRKQDALQGQFIARDVNGNSLVDEG